MAIQARNKRDMGFSSTSMADLVFLLLIFFMLTSTLVAPNAIKLLLPSSKSKTMAKQSVTVYINDKLNYFVEETRVAETDLTTYIRSRVGKDSEATIVLRADKTVPVQYIVNVIDAVNEINQTSQTKHKVILATSPK